jgi:predicted RNA-binding Zn ribbon-like protein
MPVSSPIPPHNLELVIEFVNTLDVETETEELATPVQLAEWLADHELLDDSVGTLRSTDLAAAVELREALRAVLRGHIGDEVDATAGERLEQVAERGQLSVWFDADGAIRIAPRASGYDGAAAGLLVPVAHAALDGTWRRVKACVADTCQAAFYDKSRNRSGRWCEMAVCGNRTKVRSYRSKHPH